MAQAQFVNPLAGLQSKAPVQNNSALRELQIKGAVQNLANQGALNLGNRKNNAAFDLKAQDQGLNNPTAIKRLSPEMIKNLERLRVSDIFTKDSASTLANAQAGIRTPAGAKGSGSALASPFANKISGLPIGAEAAAKGNPGKFKDTQGVVKKGTRFTTPDGKPIKLFNAVETTDTSEQTTEGKAGTPSAAKASVNAATRQPIGQPVRGSVRGQSGTYQQWSDGTVTLVKAD
mgnify:FL=1|tara:strand:- start:8804 stop:9499 length:696 start_codon:yes stop_codon:yes gene_type:complete